MTWLWWQINTSYCRLSMRVFILRQGAESVTVVKHLQIHRAVNCRPLCGPTEKMAQEENKFSGALKRNHFGFWKASHLSSQHSFTDSQGLSHCCFWLQQHTLYWPKTCRLESRPAPYWNLLEVMEVKNTTKEASNCSDADIYKQDVKIILLSKRNGLQSPSNPYRELIKEILILILCGKFHSMLKTSKANRKCNFFSVWYFISLFYFQLNVG